MATSPLAYIVRELGIKMADYSVLSQKDKDELKQYAVEEMAIRGIE